MYVVAQSVHVLFFWLGGQRVQIGEDKKAFVFVLQTHAIGQASYIVPQVQFARWPSPVRMRFLLILTSFERVWVIKKTINSEALSGSPV